MEKKTITINIDEDVLKKLKELQNKNGSSKKGFLGETISIATKRYIEEREGEEARKELLRLLKKGYNMGKLTIKRREEIYDR